MKATRKDEYLLAIITVDFAQYPTLHKQLLKLADEEIRTPEGQFRYMVKTTLGEMEEKAKEEVHV